MYFAHVPPNGEHKDFLYSWATSHVLISSILSTLISNKALEMVPNIWNSFILPFHCGAFELCRAERSSAWWNVTCCHRQLTECALQYLMIDTWIPEKPASCWFQMHLLCLYSMLEKLCCCSHSPGYELWHISSYCLGQFHIKCFMAI